MNLFVLISRKIILPMFLQIGGARLIVFETVIVVSALTSGMNQYLSKLEYPN